MTGPANEHDSAMRLLAGTRDLLGRAGIDCPMEPAITRLTGGGNNGVFRVDTRGESYILKQYFRHAEDPRDRFGTETGFSGFLWRNGVRSIPELLAASEAEGLALYRFIAGRTLTAAEIDASCIDRAAKFCREIFRLQVLPEAQQMPIASEGCFSMGDHLACVDRRIARLRSIPAESGAHADAIAFVHEELEPCWEEVRGRLRQGRMSPDDPAERVLSPSDFGFHNAILAGSTRLFFHDFEYAGWDDPAKLVCDFFCQVEVPAPRSMMRRFMEGLLCPDTGQERLAKRVECLLPVYVLKWCAIVLNDFVPIDSARRRFSAAKPPSAGRLADQLDKARRLRQSVLTG